MIICKERKIGVFMVPKNASSTLSIIFENVPVFFAEHAHLNFQRAWEQVNQHIPDFKKYRFYAVYRDPVDRFVSAFVHAKATQAVRMLQSFYGFYAMRHLSQSKPLPTEWQERLDRISVMDILNNTGYLQGLITYSYNPVFMPQTYWLNHPVEMRYLNFHTFDESVKELLDEFEIHRDTMPRSRVSDKKPVLTQEEIEAVRNYYAEDYSFFEKEGLTTWQT